MDNIEHYVKASEIKKETDPIQDHDEKIENLLSDITKNINIIKNSRIKNG